MENTDLKKKILIIDDDADLRTVLKDKLDFSGFDTVCAVDGEDGLTKALEIHPDLILLDILMPKMNGWQTLDKLRQDAWGKGAHVIMLTAMEDMNNVAAAMDKNSLSYLVKTSQTLDGIVAHVREALRRI